MELLEVNPTPKTTQTRLKQRIQLIDSRNSLGPQTYANYAPTTTSIPKMDIK